MALAVRRWLVLELTDHAGEVIQTARFPADELVNNQSSRPLRVRAYLEREVTHLVELELPAWPAEEE